MTDEEKKVVCENCEYFQPVIHLDSCSTSNNELVEVLISENRCPLRKWDGDTI